MLRRPVSRSISIAAWWHALDYLEIPNRDKPSVQDWANAFGRDAVTVRKILWMMPGVHYARGDRFLSRWPLRIKLLDVYGRSLEARGRLFVRYRPGFWAKAPVGGLLVLRHSLITPTPEWKNVWVAAVDGPIDLPAYRLARPICTVCAANLWEGTLYSHYCRQPDLIYGWPEGTEGWRFVKPLVRIRAKIEPSRHDEGDQTDQNLSAHQTPSAGT